MTALCGGGASQAKPGVNATIIFSGSALGTLLGNSGSPWGIAAAGSLGVMTYDALNLCTSDPPAAPNITAADWIALVALGDYAAHITALQKFHDLVTIAAWYALCECAAVATPAEPKLPPPASLPTFPVPGVQPCFSNTISHTAIYDPAGTVDLTGIQNALGPSGANVNQVRGGVTQHATRLPTPLPTTALFSLQTPPGGGGGEGNVIEVEFYNAANAQVATFEVGPGNLTDHLYTNSIAIPPTADHWFVSHANSFTNPPVTTDRISLVLQCAAGSGTIATPCVSDPATMAMLEQILQYVQLIQRQKAPFAYVPGTRHNGLTGNGQFAVQGLIGVSVILATLPPYLGNLAGDPPELFDVGYVTLGTVDGWHRSVRIDHSPTLVLPIEGSETLLGYSLAPGVVVDVLELRREA